MNCNKCKINIHECLCDIQRNTKYVFLSIKQIKDLSLENQTHAMGARIRINKSIIIDSKPKKHDLRLILDDKQDWLRFKQTCEAKGKIWQMELRRLIKEYN